MNSTGSNMTADQYTQILIAEFLKTEDFKRITNSMTHGLLEKWAGESRVKKWLAPAIEKRMKKSLFGPELTTEDASALPDAAKPDSIKMDPLDLADPLIALINDMLAKAEQAGQALTELPYDKKEALLEKIISQVDFGKLCPLSGPLAKTLNEIHDKKPTFVSDQLQEKLTAWVDGLDFTTTKDYLVKSQDDLVAISKIVNEALWKSEDRLIQALEILPALANLLNRNLGVFLTRLNKLKIEELTDLFLHLFEQLDGEALGTVLNANANINRKIARGTEELRDPNTDIPSSENIMMQKYEEVAIKMDPNLILNMRMTIEDLKVPFREWLMSD